MPESLRKPERIAAHLALVDDRGLVRVDELDRVFHREDVGGLPLVDQVDDGRQRGGLPRPGRAGHQHESALELREAGNDPGNAKIRQALDLGRDSAKYRSDRIALEEDVHPESAATRKWIRSVQLEAVLELLPLSVGQHPVYEFAQRSGGQGFVPGYGPKATVDANLRREACGQMKVGGTYVHHVSEQVGDCGVPGLVRSDSRGRFLASIDQIDRSHDGTSSGEREHHAFTQEALERLSESGREGVGNGHKEPVSTTFHGNGEQGAGTFGRDTFDKIRVDHHVIEIQEGNVDALGDGLENIHLTHVSSLDQEASKRTASLLLFVEQTFEYVARQQPPVDQQLSQLARS